MENNDVQGMPSVGNALRNIVGNQPKPELAEMVEKNEDAPMSASAPAPAHAPEPVAVDPTPAPEPEPAQEQEYSSWMESSASAPVEANDDGPSQEEKLRVFESLMQDKEVQLFLEAKRAGKSLTEVSKEYQTIDYSNMSVEDLAKHYGTHLGLNEEQIEESVDSLSSLNPIQKHELTMQWRDKLNSVQASKIEQLVGNYKQSAVNQEAVMQKLFQDVEKEASFIQDKDLFGAKISQKDAEGFKEWVRAYKFDPLNPDGTYNASKLRNLYIAEVLMPQIQKANYAKGQSEGRKEVLKEIHRPSENSAVASKLPEVKSNQSDTEKAQKALRAMMSGKF